MRGALFQVQDPCQPEWVVLIRNFAGSEELCPHLRAVAKPQLHSIWH